MVDAVVIGAGPNGLVAANLLADHGWSVTVLEEQPEPGGAVRSGETLLPGFVTDLFSGFYPLAAASPIVAGLHLEQHGLRWCHAPLVLADPGEDGSCAVISRDVDETAASLDAFAGGDGDAWRNLYELWARVQDPLLGALFTPFPPVRHGLRLLARLGRGDTLRFARMGLLPVRTLGEEEFHGAGGPVLLGGNALHTDLGPDAAGSGMFGWLLCMLGQSVGFPVPAGGAGQLAGALTRRLRAKGGDLRCASRVTKVVVRDGRAVGVRLADGSSVAATRAVLADIDAPQLFRELVGEQLLPPPFVRDLQRFHWDSATVKINWALRGPIPWTAGDAVRAGTVHVTGGMDAMTAHSAQLAMGLVPAEPMLVVGQTTTADPTRSPAGTESAWCYTHVPQHTRGDAADRDNGVRGPGARDGGGSAGGAGNGPVSGRWDRRDTQLFVDRVEARMERFAPGFRDLILARDVQTPLTMPWHNRCLHGGAVNSGTAGLHQQLVFRPVPGPGRPGTPIRSLFLASASAHPGGGVHGAPGANAARAALAAGRPDRRVLALAARRRQAPIT